MITLPKSGWKTHAEQLDEESLKARCWHARTELTSGVVVQSKIVPVLMAGAPEPIAWAFVTIVFSVQGYPIAEPIVASTAERGEVQHQWTVRNILDGMTWPLNQPMGEA